MLIREVYHKLINAYPNHEYISDIVIRALIMKAENIAEMSQFFLFLEKEMNNINLLDSLISRVANGEPYQYVINEATFLNNNYYVDSRVLIPRMETEELVLETLQRIKKLNKKLMIADIGTGSGCIAISLNKLSENCKVFASDISSSALEVASFNARNLNAAVEFMQGDLLMPFISRKIKLDIIVSNPPYIKNADEIDKSVLEYEPHSAVLAKHGIDFYERLLKSCHKVLNKDAMMFFEINYDQKDMLSELIRKLLPHSAFEFKKDGFGLWRILAIKYLE